MKTNPMKVKLTAACWLLTCSAWLMIPAGALAQAVIGSWQNTTGDGWIDWSTGDSITNVAVTNIYSFVSGVVPGYAQSLQVTKAGYYQGLSVKLENLPGGRAAFLTNNLLNFTFSVPAAGTNTAGYSQLYQLVVNANGYGFTGQAFSSNTWTATGSTGNNAANGQPNFYFYSGAGVRTQTVTFNYAGILPAIASNNTANSGYIELIFIFNNGGGAPNYFWVNNVTLSGGAPTAITYVVDNFASNGVSPSNPTNYDYYSAAYDYSASNCIESVWGDWFGAACTNIVWDGSVSTPGSTNGSMELQLSLSAGVQFVLWDQGSGNDYYALNVGYPQYTNVSCDVMFDPSSTAGTFSTATSTNATYGYVRLGVRTSSYGQDWFYKSPQITNAGQWVHLNAPLSATDPNVAPMVGGLLIGEDTGSGAAGGTLSINGGQTLYVANIELTGPLAVPYIPPPTLGAVQKAKPGLRIFAGSTQNTYDRAEVVTVSQNVSPWDSAVTGPVAYSFTLLDYPTDGNINQTMLQLIPVGSSVLNGQSIPQPGTDSEYLDYEDLNGIWLVLNPFSGAGYPAGAVTCTVEWKVNGPTSGANPTNTALIFTNSTAVGTWALVFTSTGSSGSGAGYVVDPAGNHHAFTINDPTIASDFAEPMVAIFGLQPNTTAGEGEYEDWGQISITGVSGGPVSEDFTTEGSDLTPAGITPSGNFVANAISSTYNDQCIIQTTNDAWWVNWSFPASGFTLASSTNLVSPNWINPGWYSSYSDTNAPRVMPLGNTFGSKYWVLLPYDDLPTADGSQNQSPPAAGPVSPKAFFLTATNVVSP
jgi:hypothetical protein